MNLVTEILGHLAVALVLTLGQCLVYNSRLVRLYVRYYDCNKGGSLAQPVMSCPGSRRLYF